MASTGMAKALGVMLATGAVLMAYIAYNFEGAEPYRIDTTADRAIMWAVLGVWFAVYAVLGCFAGYDAVRLSRRRDLGALQASANLVKLVAVPFFILNLFALTQVVLAVGANDSDRLGLDGFLLGLLLVFLTYVAMLPTSAYGVAMLVLLRKDDRIGRVFFGVAMALHFLFVVDVLSTIVVVEVARGILGTARPPGRFSKNLLTGVLAAGSAIAVPWLVFFAILLIVHREDHYYLDSGFLTGALYRLAYGVSVEFILLVVVPIVPLVAFRTAVRLFLMDDLETLGRTARNVKLVMIPLFVQNFAVCTIVVFFVSLIPVIITRGELLFAGPGGFALIGIFTLTGLVPAAIGTYLMLLPTSIYSIAYFSLLLRHRAITPGAYILHTLLQFVYVADIISTLVITRRRATTLALV